MKICPLIIHATSNVLFEAHVPHLKMEIIPFTLSLFSHLQNGATEIDLLYRFVASISCYKMPDTGLFPCRFPFPTSQYLPAIRGKYYLRLFFLTSLWKALWEKKKKNLCSPRLYFSNWGLSGEHSWIQRFVSMVQFPEEQLMHFRQRYFIGKVW